MNSERLRTEYHYFVSLSRSLRGSAVTGRLCVVLPYPLHRSAVVTANSPPRYPLESKTELFFIFVLS